MEKPTYQQRIKPLPLQDELNLIKDVKAGEENSLVALIKQHSGTVINIMSKYLPDVKSSGTYFQDIYGEKDYIIYKAAESFKPEKNVRFSTWVSEQAKYVCLNALNHSKKTKLEDSEALNSHIENGQFISSSDKSLDSKYILHIISQFSDKRLRVIFKRRHFNNKDKPTPYWKIAKKLNLSTQQVINLYNKGRVLIKSKLEGSEFPDTI